MDSGGTRSPLLALADGSIQRALRAPRRRDTEPQHSDRRQAVVKEALQTAVPSGLPHAFAEGL